MVGPWINFFMRWLFNPTFIISFISATAATYGSTVRLLLISSAALLTWRLWKFSLWPLFHPKEIPYLPYWIPCKSNTDKHLGVSAFLRVWRLGHVTDLNGYTTEFFFSLSALPKFYRTLIKILFYILSYNSINIDYYNLKLNIIKI